MMILRLDRAGKVDAAAVRAEDDAGDAGRGGEIATAHGDGQEDGAVGEELLGGAAGLEFFRAARLPHLRDEGVVPGVGKAGDVAGRAGDKEGQRRGGVVALRGIGADGGGERPGGDARGEVVLRERGEVEIAAEGW